MKASKTQTSRKNLNERLKELKCINEHNFNWYAFEKVYKNYDRAGSALSLNKTCKDIDQYL